MFPTQPAPAVASGEANKSFHSPRLADLPLDRETLGVYLRGVVSVMKKPRRWGDVLAALVARAGTHSDRVWPGIETLAADSGTSPSTVKRVLRWARAALGVRVVRGRELADGPGPHRFEGTRRGDLPVNTYDLSRLSACLPDRWRAILRDAVRSAAFPDDDPFLADTVIATSQAENAPVCPVDTQGSVGEGEPGARKTQGAPAPAGVLRGVKIDPHKEEGPGYRALRDLGVWPAVAARIAARRGDDWALRLASYARWSKGVEDKARYARAVADGWEDQGWPDWFVERWDRERARSRRAIAAPAPAPPPRVCVAAPLPADPLDALTPPERAALLARALALLPPPLRPLAAPGRPAHGVLLEKARSLTR